MNSKIQEYYNGFSAHLLKSFVGGDRRTECIRAFLRDSVSPHTLSILEIGCGVGANALYIANRIAPKAKILAIDISRKNIELAQILCATKNVTFKCADAVEDDIGESKFSVIILPDVYEHIPKDKRSVLHQRISRLLSEKGKVIITVPYPLAQEAARLKGQDLQIVDEPVTLDDFLKFAQDIRGTLTYYSLISVSYTNEYVHAIIERGVQYPTSLSNMNRIPIKRAAYEPSYYRFLKKLKRKICRHFRKSYVNAKLKKSR